MNRKYLALLAPVLLTAPQVEAHHSFAATYHEDQTQKVEGDLVEFLFRNSKIARLPNHCLAAQYKPHVEEE